MELQCLEYFGDNRAYADPALLDPKVLESLLDDEDKCGNGTWINNQKDITVEMRRIVIVWMKEVTEEQKCQLEVFLLAVNYMNRVLNTWPIKKNQLQLLGTACMLIASKLRETTPLTAKLLIFYTDNSITLYELLSYEQLVLSKLKWNIAVVTPLDFLQRIILMDEIRNEGISTPLIDERAKALISYCACEHTFWGSTPSIIAASCIVSAIAPNKSIKNRYNFNKICEKICRITRMETDVLRQNLKQIDDMLDRARSTMNDESERNIYVTSDPRKNEFTTPPLLEKSVEIETATTPTDVHNIDF